VSQGTPAEVLAAVGKGKFAAMLPPLWQIKLGLEAACEVSFGDWRQDDEAVADLASLIISQRRGGVKSA
jgi:hypothetical protein